MLVSCSVDLWLWKLKSCVTPKRRFTYELYGAISQKIRKFRLSVHYLYWVIDLLGDEWGAKTVQDGKVLVRRPLRGILRCESNIFLDRLSQTTIARKNWFSNLPNAMLERRCHLMFITLIPPGREEFYRGLQGYDVMQAGAKVPEEHYWVPTEARCLILTLMVSRECSRTFLISNCFACRW